MVRAAFTASAPIDSLVTISNPVAVLADEMIRIFLRSPVPTRQLCTKLVPSRQGTPSLLLNSTGAAPVPPSAPSTVMKSGVIPVSNMALQMAKNSYLRPTHNLNPTGFPPLRPLSLTIKSSSPLGVLNSLCPGGEITSSPILTNRILAISGDTLAAGSTPP